MLQAGQDSPKRSCARNVGLPSRKFDVIGIKPASARKPGRIAPAVGLPAISHSAKLSAIAKPSRFVPTGKGHDISSREGPNKPGALHSRVRGMHKCPARFAGQRASQLRDVRPDQTTYSPGQCPRVSVDESPLLHSDPGSALRCDAGMEYPDGQSPSPLPKGLAARDAKDGR